MKQAELQHYRHMLQAQALEPPRRRLFGRAPTEASSSPPELGADEPAPAAPPLRRDAPLFGRRPADPNPPRTAEPLLLDQLAPAQAAEALAPPRLALRMADLHLSETPFHAEDLADPQPSSGPAPGIIAGWSAVRPPSAETRLLRRLGAVVEAERQGLAARLVAAGIEAPA